MKFFSLLAALALASGFVTTVHAADPEYLRIIGTDTKFVVKNAAGKETVIQRVMTPCAKNKGWLQPLVPVPGVHPVTEIEMLGAMNDRDALVVDMREPEDRANGTIPGSMHIPLDELRARLSELPKDKEIIASCQSGQRSYFACRLLAQHGFQVRNLAGSWRTFSTATR